MSQEEGGGGGRRRRRAALEDSDDDDDDNASLFGAGRRTSSSGAGGGTDSRAARLAQRAAQRRRLLQEEQQRGVVLAGDDDGDEEDAVNVALPDDDDDDDNDDDGVVDDDVDGARVRRGEEDDEDDGEDLLDNAERDYQRIAALDTYGAEGLDDDGDYEELNYEERRAAEAAMARRDRRNAGFYNALGGDDDDLDGEDDEARQSRRAMFQRGRSNRQSDDADDDDDEEGGGIADVSSDEEEDLDGDDPVNLEAFDVPLREWIAQDRTRKEIQRKFRAFLKHFVQDDNHATTTAGGGGGVNSNDTDDDEAAMRRRNRRRGNGLYEQKIRTACAHNASSLTVSYLHLMQAEPVLAYWLADAPTDMLLILNEAATRHVVSLFPSYQAIIANGEIHVRISDLPICDSLRDLRRSHLDKLVLVQGVVTRRSAVTPQLLLAYYSCQTCRRHTVGPFRVPNSGGGGGHGGGGGAAAVAAMVPEECPNCPIAHFRLHPTMSLYRNVQRVQLQETPGSVPPGRVPRTKEVWLSDDLIDVAAPGEQVDVTGVFQHSFDAAHTIQSGFPVFGTFIHANHVQKRGGDANSACNLSEKDVADILALGRDPKIGEKIVRSLAPSIYGHEFCKMALAMSLFGGVAKHYDQNKHRIRGDVNVLLLGDPGTAKSQLLRYAEQTAPRAVYSTGKGASAVGLTASVHKDIVTKEWTLEGGALVLADQGCCLIDEFDKMNEQDRTSIHEAMEQQSISVSKAGIVTSLQARCSVIAAANPIGGRYDSSSTLADNVELTDPILQRFDILCVLQDTVDPVADERLARFVTASHMRSVPTREMQQHPSSTTVENTNTFNANADLIPQDLLRKYIQYARTNVRPALRGNGFDQEKVASLYVALRRESAASGGVPIAVRHVEAVMRMAEAHAKMHLRDYVRDDDMDASIRMMLESFITAQKFSVRRALKRSFGKFLTTGQDRAHLLLHILQDMFRKEQLYQVIRLRQMNQAEEALERLEVPLDELESRARERRIYDVSEFCHGEAFAEAGYEFIESRGIIARAIAP
jgi:DNA replication licensing factor MCM2